MLGVNSNVLSFLSSWAIWRDLARWPLKPQIDTEVSFAEQRTVAVTVLLFDFIVSESVVSESAVNNSAVSDTAVRYQ